MGTQSPKRSLPRFLKKCLRLPSKITSQKPKYARLEESKLSHTNHDNSSRWSLQTTTSSRWSIQTTAGSVTQTPPTHDNSSRGSTRATAGSVVSQGPAHFETGELRRHLPFDQRSLLNPDLRVLWRGLVRNENMSLRERVLTKEGLRAMDEEIGVVLELEENEEFLTEETRRLREERWEERRRDQRACRRSLCCS